MRELMYRIQNLGFGGKGLEVNVKDLGFRVKGSGFRV
jgi:hypothetical protein